MGYRRVIVSILVAISLVCLLYSVDRLEDVSPDILGSVVGEIFDQAYAGECDAKTVETYISASKGWHADWLGGKAYLSLDEGVLTLVSYYTDKRAFESARREFYWKYDDTDRYTCQMNYDENEVHTMDESNLPYSGFIRIKVQI